MSLATAQWSDTELLQAMAHEQERATREFFCRFRPVLARETRRLGVQPALRDEMVDDCLGDMVIQLMKPGGAVPETLEALLLGALRHRVWNVRRGRRRREEHEEAASDDASATGERVILGLNSQAALDASAGAEAEVPRVSPVIESLAAALDTAMTDDERMLVRWLSEWVPQTTIAEWLGISFGAVRVRIHRLRERLRTIAREHAEDLNEGDRLVLDRFLERRPQHGVTASSPQTKSTPPPSPSPAGWKGSLRRRLEDTPRPETR